MYKKILFLLTMLVSANSGVAQPDADSLLAHYPLHVGNAWDYSGGFYFLNSFFYPSWTIVTATRDSVHSNGKRYTVLESISYDMSGQIQSGALGSIRRETILQRVDTTSLNVYEVIQFFEPPVGDELLVDSLKAKQGDQIITNFGDYNNILELFTVSEQEVFGRLRTIRSLAVVNALVGFQFATASGLGEISWSGGEGEIHSRGLQGAVIDGDSLGTLFRMHSPGLSVQKNALLFSKDKTNHRLFLVNKENGLTIIDSVKIENEMAFYSQPSYHGAGYAHTTFSKGPFLIFPQDSIFLDIFVREDTQEQVFEDTLQIYARGLNGASIPRVDIPVKVDLVVSVHDPSIHNQQLPGAFSLSAYPNPIRSEHTLNIEYQLSKTENVEIDVYDILGRHITTLASQRVSPGKHKIAWASPGLPSGIYFISIVTQNRRESIRLQIIK